MRTLRTAFMLGMMSVAILVIAAPSTRAQTPHRAGLVVQFSDGSTISRCVSFSEDSITGYDLLRRSKLPIAVEFGGFGAGVCKIGNEGCSFPSQPCFCQCQNLDASCTYWVYAQLQEGAWRISGLGASNRQVRNGDVDGWMWGKGNGNTGEAPPVLTYEQICNASAVAANQPTVAPALPSAAPLPAISTATVAATLAPSATLEIAATAAPSATMMEPTVAAEPSTMPTAATAMPAATGIEATPVATVAEAHTETASNSNFNWSYVAFGVIAISLIGALALLRRRKGEGE